MTSRLTVACVSAPVAAGAVVAVSVRVRPPFVMPVIVNSPTTPLFTRRMRWPGAKPSSEKFPSAESPVRVSV